MISGTVLCGFQGAISGGVIPPLSPQAPEVRVDRNDLIIVLPMTIVRIFLDEAEAARPVMRPRRQRFRFSLPA